jgi:hypothetical protein
MDYSLTVDVYAKVPVVFSIAEKPMMQFPHTALRW